MYLFQHIRYFTRCRNEQSRNILDLINTKSEHNIDSVEVGPSLGCSDHVTLIFDFICECKVTYRGNERYLYRKCELADFASEWVNVDWISTLETNTEEMGTLFAQKYDECVKKYVTVCYLVTKCL